MGGPNVVIGRGGGRGALGGIGPSRPLSPAPARASHGGGGGVVEAVTGGWEGGRAATSSGCQADGRGRRLWWIRRAPGGRHAKRGGRAGAGPCPVAPVDPEGAPLGRAREQATPPPRGPCALVYRGGGGATPPLARGPHTPFASPRHRHPRHCGSIGLWACSKGGQGETWHTHAVAEWTMRVLELVPGL